MTAWLCSQLTSRFACIRHRTLLAYIQTSKDKPTDHAAKDEQLNKHTGHTIAQWCAMLPQVAVIWNSYRLLPIRLLTLYINNRMEKVAQSSRRKWTLPTPLLRHSSKTPEAFLQPTVSHTFLFCVLYIPALDSRRPNPGSPNISITLKARLEVSPF